MHADQQPVAMIEVHKLNPKIKDQLQKLLRTKNIKKVFFDSVKECSFLERDGIAIGGRKFDVSIAFQLLNAGLAKKKMGLKDIIREYMDEMESFSFLLEETDDTAKCVVGKVLALLALREILIEDLRLYGLVETAELEFECVNAVIDLRLTGIGVNSKKLRSILRKAKYECDQNEQAFKDYFSDTINIGSSKALMEVLNSHIKIKSRNIVFKNTKKTTLKQHVTVLPIIQSILDYRQAKGFANAASQILNCICHKTGRTYPSYNPLGAVTGRFSCSSPALQAMPKSKEFRTCFVAAKGNKLVIADYSQVELRIAAEITGDRRMIDAFKADIDFHSLTASIISGKHIDNITKFDRKAAKAVNFGIIYGMGSKGLTTYAMDNYNVALSINEAKKFQRDFFNECAYPQS